VEFLKFWLHFTDPAPNRIVFPEMSENGIILAQITCSFLENFVEDFEVESTGRIADVASNILENQNICFGAFDLYHDPCIHSLVSKVAAVCMNFAQVLEFPKIAISVYRFVRVISELHLSRCEFATLDFLLKTIKMGLSSISGPIVEESIRGLKSILNFAMAAQDVNFVSNFGFVLLKIGLLVWELLLNRRLKQILDVCPVLCSLGVMNPEIVGLVREKVCEVIPEKCDEHFGKIRDLLQDGERSGGELVLSVSGHIQALLGDLEPFGRTFHFADM
jgi:hypothetical protein